MGRNENPLYDNARLYVLQTLLAARADELFGELGVSFNRSSKMFYGCCPIHGGDNPNGFNLYPEGETVPGFWKCYTRRCADHFAKNFIGFIRGVLSHQRFNWEPRNSDKKVGFADAVGWACKFLDVELGSISVDYVDLERRRFTAGMGVLTRTGEQGRGLGLSRSQVRARLELPARYFVERGYSRDVLDRYDVGFCSDAKRPFFGRAVVPIYDEDYRFALGFTARSTHPRCETCELWHAPNLPCSDADPACSSKWTNSEGFRREHSLYNFWFAKRFISQTGTVCMCEGPGDVWRLEEAGISNGVAMLGAELTDPQQIILERSGAVDVVLLTDQDEAGQLARAKLAKQLGRSFRIHSPELPSKDLGGLSPEKTKEILGPLLKRLSNA